MSLFDAHELPTIKVGRLDVTLTADRPVTCGIHGNVIVDRRCAACDAGEPERCPSCGVTLPDDHHMIDAANRRLRRGA